MSERCERPQDRSVEPIGAPTSGERSHERTDGRTDGDRPTVDQSCADPNAHEHDTPQRCFADRWHLAHTWVYGGRLLTCDGMTLADDDRDAPERRCCNDPLCACATKPGWTGRGTEAMDT